MFQTEDRRDVERYMESIGTEYKWKEDGSIAFGYERPAMINFPLTGKGYFFMTALVTPQLELHCSIYT